MRHAVAATLTAVGCAVATVVAGGATLTGASADPTGSTGPEVAWTGPNIQVAPDGSAAFITGKYRCSGGREGTHLWVSVKQGPNLSEPDQTGSQYADAWYDTNWNFQNDPDGLTVDCDGHWHVTRYTLKQEFGTLQDGPAFVQFCLFDSSQSETEGFAFNYSWKPVYVPGS